VELVGRSAAVDELIAERRAEAWREQVEADRSGKPCRSTRERPAEVSNEVVLDSSAVLAILKREPGQSGSCGSRQVDPRAVNAAEVTATVDAG